MSNPMSIVVCPQHRSPRQVFDNFAEDLNYLWDEISFEKDYVHFASQYSVDGWRKRFALFLVKQFGYRGGNLTYFRRDQKSADAVVVPTWFFLPEGKPLDSNMYGHLREVFREGEPDEVKLFPNADSYQALAFPRPTNLELYRNFALLPDGEASYRCLQYLHANARPSKGTIDSERLSEWMMILGLLTASNAPTLRLIRMLSWFLESFEETFERGSRAEHCFSAIQALLGCNNRLMPESSNDTVEATNPHCDTSLEPDTHSNLLHLLATCLAAQDKARTRIGVNILGHLALRCVTHPNKTCLLPQIAREYVEKVDVDSLDLNCTDRSIVIIPLREAQITDSVKLRAFYLGSHIGLSPSIINIKKDESGSVSAVKSPELLNRLLQCISLVGVGPLLTSMMASEHDIQTKVVKAEEKIVNLRAAASVLATLTHEISSLFKKQFADVRNKLEHDPSPEVTALAVHAWDIISATVELCYFFAKTYTDPDALEELSKQLRDPLRELKQQGNLKTALQVVANRVYEMEGRPRSMQIPQLESSMDEPPTLLPYQFACCYIFIAEPIRNLRHYGTGGKADWEVSVDDEGVLIKLEHDHKNYRPESKTFETLNEFLVGIRGGEATIQWDEHEKRILWQIRLGRSFFTESPPIEKEQHV